MFHEWIDLFINWRLKERWQYRGRIKYWLILKPMLWKMWKNIIEFDSKQQRFYFLQNKIMWLNLKVSWLQEFIDKIDDKREVKTALNKWIKKVVFFAEWEAKVFTPVDKWFLRNSYRQKFWNLFGELYNIRKYGVFVHEWTRFIKANPFLTKTVKKNEKEFTLIMNEELLDNLSILQ